MDILTEKLSNNQFEVSQAKLKVTQIKTTEKW